MGIDRIGLRLVWSENIGVSSIFEMDVYTAPAQWAFVHVKLDGLGQARGMVKMLAPRETGAHLVRLERLETYGTDGYRIVLPRFLKLIERVRRIG